jgi:hypothetical protein
LYRCSTNPHFSAASRGPWFSAAAGTSSTGNFPEKLNHKKSFLNFSLGGGKHIVRRLSKIIV